MKERLTRILKKEREATLPIWMPLTAIYTLADNLLESGVIAPPVNPGDPVWFVLEEDGKWGVYEDVVTEAGSQWFFCPAVTGDMNNTDNRVGYDEIGTEVFLTKEEAEAACKERNRHVKIIYDRCGKEIVYCGWTTKIKEKRKRPRKFYILKLFNGNPSGYNYSEYDCELCAACSHELKKFLKGAKTVDEQERNAPGE